MWEIGELQLRIGLVYLGKFGNGHMQCPGSKLGKRRPLFFRKTELLKFGQQFGHKPAIIYQPLQKVIVVSHLFLKLLALLKTNLFIAVVLFILLIIFTLPFDVASQSHHFFNFYQDSIYR